MINTDDLSVDAWCQAYPPIKALHTGSRVICNPAPVGTDNDWLFLLTPEVLHNWEQALHGHGYWSLSGSGVMNQGNPADDLSPHLYQTDYNGQPYLNTDKLFHSWKTGDGLGYSYNFILTICEDFFNNFVLATAMAKRLNLLEKSDRITLFEGIVYDQWPLLHGALFGE